MVIGDRMNKKVGDLASEVARMQIPPYRWHFKVNIDRVGLHKEHFKY